MESDPAYEYLPGDRPTSLSEALAILDRVRETLRREGHGSYEAVTKVRGVFRKHLEALGAEAPEVQDDAT